MPEDQKKDDIIPDCKMGKKEDQGTRGQSSLCFIIPEKTMEQISLDVISKHLFA